MNESLEHLVATVGSGRSSDADSRVLIVGAHPDDAEISAGLATRILKAQPQHDVYSVTLTSGRGRDALARIDEWRTASEVMGYDAAMLFDYPDGDLRSYEREVIGTLESIRADYDPTLVIFHTDRDTHQDHRAVHDAVGVAMRNGPSLLEMRSPSTHHADFRVHWYITTKDVRKAFEAAGALKHYASQADIAPVHAQLARFVTDGRSKYPKQHAVWSGAHDHSLIDSFAHDDPLGLRERTKADLSEVYRAIMLMHPQGTVYAQGFSPNAINFNDEHGGAY